MFLPVAIGSEINIRLSTSLMGDQLLHAFILAGQICHRLEGLLRIVIAEMVDPHEVEGVEPPSTSRVAGMEGSGELAFIDRQPRGAVGGDVTVSVRGGGGFVDVRKVGVDGIMDREIGAAECSHEAFLRKRILLHLARRRTHGAFAGRGG